MPYGRGHGVHAGRYDSAAVEEELYRALRERTTLSFKWLYNSYDLCIMMQLQLCVYITYYHI